MFLAHNAKGEYAKGDVNFTHAIIIATLLRFLNVKTHLSVDAHAEDILFEEKSSMQHFNFPDAAKGDKT